MIIQMTQNKLKVFLLIIVFFTIYISYLSYGTSVAQKDIINDSSKTPHVFTFKEVDKMLNGYPNISSSSLPVDVWKVQYLLWEGDIEKANYHVKLASKANPHTYSGEYLQGQIFWSLRQLDSAYYYSKKAFLGWPKNINHYNSYLNVLEDKQDTISLIKAFDTLDSSLKKRPEYFKRFYASFNKIKLSFLVTNYEDQIDLDLYELVGNTYIRGYNFPNGQVIRDTTFSYTFKSKNIIVNQNGSEFFYKINSDTLNFYFKRDPNKPIAKYFSKYSPQYKTIIFRNVEFEKDKFQDQYFIKSD
jgi:hypothetical protein